MECGKDELALYCSVHFVRFVSDLFEFQSINQQHIWRQAMQYHNMLKQKHEMEQKAAAESAAKRKEIEEKVNAAKKAQSQETKEEAAERVAKELLDAEEREKNSKKAFSGGAVKKGFLDKKKKK